MLIMERQRLPVAGPRLPNRKLLVLDMNKTLCDFTGLQDWEHKIHQGIRPFVQYFLTMVYKHYDIILWSATSFRSIVSKLNVLRISNKAEYKIMQYMDNSEMMPVKVPAGQIRVKSLAAIWAKYPMFDHTNTIMIDDQYINFFDAPYNGLLIQPYCHNNYETDNELVYLATYLRKLAINCPDFSQENHRNWAIYNPTKN